MIWDVNPVIFELNWDWGFWPFDPAHFELRYYSLLFVTGLLVCFFTIRWIFKNKGYNPDKVDSLFFYSIIALIVGARLGHVLFYQPEIYFKDPIKILRIWEGGIASHGGAIGVLIALIIFSKVHKIPLLEVFDSTAVPIGFLAMCVRTGNFFNSEILGRASDVPWAVTFVRNMQPENRPPVPRHPTQIYEALAGLIIFIVMMIVYKKKGDKLENGILFNLFLLMYFSTRFFIEFFKAYQVDSLRTAGFINMGQILSLPFIIFAIVSIIFIKKGISLKSLFKKKENKEK